jgi:hypothetical protein
MRDGAVGAFRQRCCHELARSASGATALSLSPLLLRARVTPPLASSPPSAHHPAP